MSTFKLALISPEIRDDLHTPLRYFQSMDVRHFYFRGELSGRSESPATRVSSIDQLEGELADWKPDLLQAPEPFYGFGHGRLMRWVRGSGWPYFIPWLETRTPTQKFGWLAGFAWERFTRGYVDQAEFIWPVSPLQKNMVEDQCYQTELLSPGLWGTWGTEIASAPDPAERFSNQRFLFLGRLEREKGIHDLLSAWPRVVEETGWTLDIAGTGREVESVRRACRHYPGIRYRGFVPWGSLPSVWDGTSVLVSPSRPRRGWEEQVGMSNIQAMGRGIPVISTWSGAIPYFVENKESGLLTLPGSPSSLSHLMIQIATDRLLYQTLADNAHDRARRRWNRKEVIRRAERRLLKQVGGAGEQTP